MQIFGRLIATGVRVIASAFFSAILFGLIGAGATMGVAYINTHHWPESALAYVAAGIIGVLLAYATATTMFLRAIAREVMGVTKAAEDDVEKVVSHK
jgi:hypothetical protein